MLRLVRLVAHEQARYLPIGMLNETHARDGTGLMPPVRSRIGRIEEEIKSGGAGAGTFNVEERL